MANEMEKALGQTAGAKFEQLNMEFIEATFPHLQNLRPGKWHIVKLGNRSTIKTSSFAQYEHLEYLYQLTKEVPFSIARIESGEKENFIIALVF